MPLPTFLLALVGGKSERKRERERKIPQIVIRLGEGGCCSHLLFQGKGGEAKAYGLGISSFVPSYIDLRKEFHLQHTSEQSKEKDGNLGLALHGTKW